jgi:hypothetical protein
MVERRVVFGIDENQETVDVRSAGHGDGADFVFQLVAGFVADRPFGGSRPVAKKWRTA